MTRFLLQWQSIALNRASSTSWGPARRPETSETATVMARARIHALAGIERSGKFLPILYHGPAFGAFAAFSGFKKSKINGTKSPCRVRGLNPAGRYGPRAGF